MTSIRLTDSVYGTYEIDEPVLLELLDSRAVQRLRGVHQAGASYLIRSGRGVSRFQHSVGVMLLVRELGGSVEEQAAGLVHDISHTAFSHVSDRVFAHSQEDYHEKHFARLAWDSDLPEILSRHGLSPESVFDADRWSLLEQPAPQLSADRIDYTLRDLVALGEIDVAAARSFVDDLTVVDGRIGTQTLESAQWFTRQYAIEVGDVFMDVREMYANARLATAIRIALDADALGEADLFGEDAEVIDRLREFDEPSVQRILGELTQSLQVVEDEANYTTKVYPKVRLIDPLVFERPDSAVPCSDLDPSIRDVHDRIRQRAERGAFLRNADTDAP